MLFRSIGAAVNFVANVVLALLFVHFWGLPGIALSTSVMFAISYTFLLVAALLLIRTRQREAAAGKPVCDEAPRPGPIPPLDASA